MPGVGRKAKVIMNKQHLLFSEQQAVLNEKFTSYEVILVPQEGWNMAQMDDQIVELLATPGDIVFLSPIPYMLMRLCKMDIPEGRDVFLFHRDIRYKGIDHGNAKGNAPWHLLK